MALVYYWITKDGVNWQGPYHSRKLAENACARAVVNGHDCKVERTAITKLKAGVPWIPRPL